MTFYPNLRETAAAKISQFGRSAVYRSRPKETYDNASGMTVYNNAALIDIQLLDLPMDRRLFTEEVASESAAKFLVSAKEFAEASIEPEVDAEILVGSDVYKISEISPVGPAGIVVLYKMAVV